MAALPGLTCWNGQKPASPTNQRLMTANVNPGPLFDSTAPDLFQTAAYFSMVSAHFSASSGL